MSDTPDRPERGAGEYAATRPSYWRALARRHRWTIAGSAAGLILLAGAIALLVATGPSGPVTRPPGERTITPAEETAEATGAPGVSEETGTSGPSGGTGAGTSEGAATTPGSSRQPLVAFRADGWLCVAAEDGTGIRQVVPSVAGVYALSPDGSLLALVEAGTGALRLVDVARGTSVDAGSALTELPSWTPDSQWLLYTAPGPQVRRVPRSGSGGTVLFGGTMPTASVSDCETVVGLDPDGGIVVWRAGTRTISPVGTVTSLACSRTTVFYGSIDAATGLASLRAVELDGTGQRAVVASPRATRAVTFGDLRLEPKGEALVYAEHSDDGASQMYAVGTVASAPAALSVRRDCYPLSWTADGTAILFIEGNALQGDPTALMRVAPTGAARRLLVSGADR